MDKKINTDNKILNEQTIYKQRNEIKKENEISDKIKNIKNKKNSIIILYIFLILIGVANFYSSVSRFDATTVSNKMIKQGIILLVAFFTCYLTSKISYKNFLNKRIRSSITMFGIILFLVVAFAPIPSIFPTINGGKGWIHIGSFSFQITELFKVPFIGLIAWALSRGKNGGKKVPYLKNFLAVSVYTGIFFVLLLFLKDLGTGLHYVMIVAFLIFTSDITDKFLMAIIASGGGLGLFVLTAVYNFGSGYKQHRVKIYLDGIFKDVYDRMEAFQIYQSLIAFGTSGFLGKGYGNGVQKYNYIPEVETDFAIATFAEEMGFLGVISLLLLFFVMFFLIMNISDSTEDYFAKYFVTGIAGYIITQVIINIGVAIGLIPVFGVPLPFISSGGSSLIALSVAIGIVINISNSSAKNLETLTK